MAKDKFNDINNNISKDLSSNRKLNAKTGISLFLMIIFIISISCFSKIYACFPTNHVKKLWDKSQKIQKETSFVIDADYITSYVRLNGKKDSYNVGVKFYKSGDKWRSERYEDFGDERNVFVSIYDGSALHDFVNIEDSSHSGKYKPTELSINKGMIIYEQNLKDGYTQETLEDIIADFNSMDNVVNWYPKKWYNRNEKESPKIKEKTKINNIECTYIVFSPNREACVSEDYGVAIYYKESKDESKFLGTTNLEHIREYKVNKIRNDKKDILHIDKAIFDLPNVKPWHKYGEY